MQHRKALQGFTLIEVMIVVAIIAILAAIALPSYREYVLRSKRADAKAGLQAAAVWLERVSTSTGSYPSALPSELQDVESKAYKISYAPVSTGTPAVVTSYTLTATAQNSQANDKCGNFTLTSAGVQDVKNASQTAAECWNR